MNSYLLDTQIFLWYTTGDKRLSKKSRNIIESASAKRYVSMVSLWEEEQKKN